MKADNVLYLEHGKPLIFGKDRNKGIRLNGLEPEVVELGKDCQLDDLLIHDEKAEEPTLAYLLSRFSHDTTKDAVNPFPEPVGVFRNFASRPTRNCSTAASTTPWPRRARGKIEDLFKAEDVWTVE